MLKYQYERYVPSDSGSPCHPRPFYVIEDDAAIRRGIVDALRHAGYRIFKAARGDVGRELATARSYDLLLLDLVLPGGDGLDLLHRTKYGRHHPRKQ